VSKIFVTKSFLPPKEEYFSYISKTWDNGILTNGGPLLLELEEKLRDYLEVKNCQFVTNGTIALQLALDGLGIKEGEVITTPFSYVATTSSILWERCEPVFVDIERDNFTIDVKKIEAAITPNTRAIMAVHVFGYACDVEKIEKLAEKHNIKVIYDAAHAFGVRYKGKSLLDYGDVSTLSFHATKLFHTVEGGACIAKDDKVNARIDLSKRFGHHYNDFIQVGINGKNSEFHAAMGLANFPYIEHIIESRRKISELYDKLLDGLVQLPKKQKDLEYNYAYYPVVFKSEKTLLKVFDVLAAEYIFPRRYFYPSLNNLPYVKKQSCPVSEDISPRIACLPLFVGLEHSVVEKIAELIRNNV
jgi:dTDP-4-amino-4,6-dideoxygalactose transaminase